MTISPMRDKISYETGFDHGGRFRSAAAVRDYCTVTNLLLMGWDPHDCPSQATLDDYAETIIRNRWHMTEETAD